MPFPAAARDYLLQALDGTPDVLLRMVESRSTLHPLWDRRPEPDRFTLREIIAHLADWEPIWLERVSRTAEGGCPFLPSVDESALAIENDYAQSDPGKCLQRYRQGRDELVRFLGGLGDAAWDETAEREFVGVLTLQQQASMVLSHDGYHLRQAAQFLNCR
jgi:hypothetical protein